jgi:hypothetical protein
MGIVALADRVMTYDETEWHVRMGGRVGGFALLSTRDFIPLHMVGPA